MNALLAPVRQFDELLSILKRQYILTILTVIAAFPMFTHIGDDTAKAEAGIAALEAPCELNAENVLLPPGQTPAERAAFLERTRQVACQPAARVHSVLWTPFFDIFSDGAFEGWWLAAAILPAFVALAYLLLPRYRRAIDELMNEVWPIAWRLLVLAACGQLAVYAGRLGGFAIVFHHSLPNFAANHQHIVGVGVLCASLISVGFLLISERLIGLLQTIIKAPELVSATS